MNDVNDGGFAVDCEASDVHHYVAKQSSSTYTEVLDVMWRRHLLALEGRRRRLLICLMARRPSARTALKPR